MLEEGISYPFKGDNALGRNVIGGLLVAFSWLIVPGLVHYGYLVRVLEDTVSGAEEPPEFDEWGEMILDGLKLMVITLVYAIVPFAIAGVIMLFGIGLGAAGGDGSGGIVAGFGLLGMLVLFLASLVLFYVLPAAVTNFAREGNVGAAFDFDTITDVLTSSEYVVAWLLPIVIYTVAYFAIILLAITIIGLIFVPWVSFYASVVIFQMFGQAYATALDVDTSGTATEPDEHLA